LRSAAAEAVLLREQIGRTGVELAAAREDTNAWRGKAEIEATARASADALASRVRGLEAENSELRSQLLDLTASRSAQADWVPGLQEQVAGLNQRIVMLSSTVAELQTRLVEEQRTHAEKVEALTDVRGEIENHLKAIASDSLRDNQTSFLQLANAVFEKHKEGAADLDARREAVEALVIPMREALQACQTNLAELEKARSQAYGALSSELRAVVDTQMAVRSETSKLVNALRAAPKTRGRWGEHTLRNGARTGGAEPFLRLLDRTGLRPRGRNIAPGRRDPAARRSQHRRGRESADDRLSRRGRRGRRRGA
jgi:DNA recombination protein RmuC